jgi:hypothetical protein
MHIHLFYINLIEAVRKASYTETIHLVYLITKGET